MKKAIALFILGIASGTLLGQKLTDEEVKELEPYHYQTKLILTALPAYLDAGGRNLGYGYGVNVDGFFLKRFSFSAGLTNSYSDQNFEKGNDHDVSDSYQGIKKAGTTYANFNFHILDKIAMGKIRVEKYRGSKFSSGASGTTQTDMYDVYKRRGPVRKIIAVRGGIYSWSAGVTPESDDQWYMVKTGTTVSTLATDKTFTNLNTTNFSVGISTGKFVSKTDMGGGGVVSYFRNFYVDLLINSSTTLDNYTDKTKNTYVFQMGKGTLSTANMGWRAGWKFMGLGRKYWTGGYYIEGGNRPGIEGRGPYFQLGLILGLRYPFVPK